MSSSPPAPRLRAFVITALSLAAFLTWNQLRVFKHPWGDLSGGTYTDHLSHMNAARAFPRVGLDIWRKPAIALSREPSAGERAQFPDDVHPGGSWKGGIYVMDGFPIDKPWVTSWGQIPRLYPPGDMLLVAPVAYLYQHTSLSLTGANRYLYALFLIYAHAAIFLIVLSVLEEDSRKRPVLLVASIAACAVLLVWTLQGFYDAAALTPLILCARYLRARRGLAACVAFSVAAFIHFRAFFFAPWALYAIWIFFRERQYSTLRARDLAAGALGAFCAGSSLFVFKLISPVLAQQHVNNSVNLAAADGAALWMFGLVALACAAALVYAQAWFDVVTFAWLLLMLLFVKEAHEWHIVIPLAWLAAPVLFAQPRRDEVVRGARLVLLAYVAIRIMVN